MYAFAAAADPSRYPDAGEPWQISKVYYDRIFNAPRIEAMYQYLLVTEPETSQLAQLGEIRERMRDRPNLTTTQVEVGAFLEVRDAALRAHASQVAPDSAFFFWPNDLQRQAWPFEDFQLAVSLVDSPLPETDLFAGIRDDAADDREVTP
jgi:mycothiol S-conjugate amidase